MPQVTNQNQLFPKGNFITNASLKTFSTKCLLLNKHKFTITHSTSQAHIRRAIHRHDRYLTLLRSVFLPLHSWCKFIPGFADRTNQVWPAESSPSGQIQEEVIWGTLSHITSQVHVTVIRLPLGDGHL